MAKNLTYTMKDVFCAVRQFQSQRRQFYSMVIVKSVSCCETMNSDPEPNISLSERNNSNPHFPTKTIAVSLDQFDNNLWVVKDNMSWHLLGVISMAARMTLVAPTPVVSSWHPVRRHNRSEYGCIRLLYGKERG